jgi:hypothetical protein
MKHFLWIFLILVVQAQQPCFELRNSNLRLGAYRPQCTGAGFYRSKQCHGSTGYCWCVSPHGTRRLAPVPPGHPLDCY